MANTPQAKKRIRRNARRAEINGARISRIRTLVKKVEAALAAGDKSAAATGQFSPFSLNWPVASHAACCTRTLRLASSAVSRSGSARSPEPLHSIVKVKVEKPVPLWGGFFHDSVT